MKTKRSAIVFKILSKLIVCLALLWLTGCGNFWAQEGEPVAEGHRRHLRNLSVNQQSLSGDIDRALLSDKPSKITDLRVPPQNR